MHDRHFRCSLRVFLIRILWANKISRPPCAIVHNSLSGTEGYNIRPLNSCWLSYPASSNRFIFQAGTGASNSIGCCHQPGQWARNGDGWRSPQDNLRWIETSIDWIANQSSCRRWIHCHHVHCYKGFKVWASSDRGDTIHHPGPLLKVRLAQWDPLPCGQPGSRPSALCSSCQVLLERHRWDRGHHWAAFGDNWHRRRPLNFIHFPWWAWKQLLSVVQVGHHKKLKKYSSEQQNRFLIKEMTWWLSYITLFHYDS